MTISDEFIKYVAIRPIGLMEITSRLVLLSGAGIGWFIGHSALSVTIGFGSAFFVSAMIIRIHRLYCAIMGEPKEVYDFNRAKVFRISHDHISWSKNRHAGLTPEFLNGSWQDPKFTKDFVTWERGGEHGTSKVIYRIPRYFRRADTAGEDRRQICEIYVDDGVIMLKPVKN
jgi:hypothetical protein